MWLVADVGSERIIHDAWITGCPILRKAKGGMTLLKPTTGHCLEVSHSMPRDGTLPA
jgi:hypothetical protein